MAVEGAVENICFESMGGFGQYYMGGSVLGIEDGFCSQELQNLDPLSVDYSYDNLSHASSSLRLEIFQSLSPEFEKQRIEIDRFLQLENKRLRSSIMEEERRQQAVIMQKCESRIKNLMLQKDEELAFARNKTGQLQYMLKEAENEARVWEKSAKEKEAIISNLNNRLSKVTEPNVDDDDDAVSFCDSSSSCSSRSRSKEMSCKLCQARKSCVVLFPCRHLCCCKSCEPLLGYCPVCQTVKELSLEVFLV